MTYEAAIAFSLAMVVLAVTPGPGVFAAVAQALAGGFRSALAVIGGIIVGDIIFLMLAVFGLSAIAHLAGDFFFVVKLAGGGYLIWLGVKLWLSKSEGVKLSRAETGRKPGQCFLGGLFITLGNPKVILFYVGFLPTFMDLTRLAPLDIALVAGLVTGVLGGVMATYAYLAARVRGVFKSRRAARNLNRGAGTVMIGTGVVLVSR